MNLDQLEAVSVIAQNGSFRAAADILNRSPSSLSELVKSLEDEFQLQIFDRTTYRARLTDAGQAFLKSAETTLASAKQTVRVATELGTNQAETHLNVAIDQLINPRFIDLIVEQCGKPQIPVNLVVERTLGAGSVEALLAGRIQLALAPCPADSSQVDRIDLEELKLVGAIDRSLLGERRLSVELLSSLAQIKVYANHFQELTLDLNANAFHREGSHRIFVPEHTTKVRLIKSGMGWGRISERDFENSPTLVMIDHDVVEQVPFNMCLMRAKSKPIGATARAIWSAFEKEAR